MDLYDQFYQILHLFKYRILFIKMALDAPTIPSTKFNFYLLTNVETLLGLNLVM
jgi:hypothetical protein